MRKTLVRNMKDLRNGQDPLLEAWEGASPIGLPDLPEAFFEEMRRHFRLDGSGRLLVLWCGAGVFLPLAESFESILIADPEPDRLAEARRDATRMGIRNVIPLEGGAELLHPRMGRFRLVIVQDAFLRRDRMRRLSFLAKMTEPEGGVVIAEVHRCSPLTDWQKVALEVLRQLEERLPVEKTIPCRPVEPLGHSPFRQVNLFIHRWTQRRTIDQTVKGILAASCPFSKKRSAEEALRHALRKAHSSNILEERLRLTAVFAK